MKQWIERVFFLKWVIVGSLILLVACQQTPNQEYRNPSLELDTARKNSRQLYY